MTPNIDNTASTNSDTDTRNDNPSPPRKPIDYHRIVGDGKKLTFDRKKGNCLACHIIDDGELAGNAGPPLLAMKIRFPEKKDLFDKIWDSTKTNPDSFMPPFGKHGLLTKGEIDLIIEYLYTL